MNINWVISDSMATDPLLDFERLKELGSIWGSWRTWRNCRTDNVVCYDLDRAQELVKRNFQTQCNFYIPNKVFVDLGRPVQVQAFEGTFVHDVDHREELIALQLAAGSADIVLLLGFDFQKTQPHPDRLVEHRLHNYWNLARQAMVNNPKIQWVVIDHPGKVRSEIASLDNVTTDTLTNILP